jgi:hypothetical protein
MRLVLHISWAEPPHFLTHTPRAGAKIVMGCWSLLTLLQPVPALQFLNGTRPHNATWAACLACMSCIHLANLNSRSTLEEDVYAAQLLIREVLPVLEVVDTFLSTPTDAGSHHTAAGTQQQQQQQQSQPAAFAAPLLCSSSKKGTGVLLPPHLQLTASSCSWCQQHLHLKQGVRCTWVLQAASGRPVSWPNLTPGDRTPASLTHQAWSPAWSQFCVWPRP